MKWVNAEKIDLTQWTSIFQMTSVCVKDPLEEQDPTDFNVTQYDMF